MLLRWRHFQTAPRPLPAAIRLQMEKLFRTSFSNVTYKIGPEPLAIGARAFACGECIFFAPDAWNPRSRETNALLAHELSHVVQQRSQRLMSAFGARAGVVYEPALEAEADAMAFEARFGWKCGVNYFAPVRPGVAELGQPFEIWEGSYQIAAGSGNRLAGSVRVHESGASAIEITDLKVNREFRRLGIGRVLVHAALQTGLYLAKRYAVLASGDSGSGRLSQWYEGLGFSRSGFHRGYAEYAAKISHLLSGTALFTARPLCGQLIQCMESDEERRRKREERFGAHLEKNKEEEEARLTIVRRLTQLAISAIHEYAMGITSTTVLDSATKHGDHNPAKTFFAALECAAGQNNFGMIEVQDVNGEEINITFRLNNNWTVTASYSFRYKRFTIFHSGKTASGVGYGTRLGEY